MINLRSKPPTALVSAIRREQALSVRRIDLIRMWGASGLLLLFGVLDLLLRQAEWGGGGVPLIAAYWVAAAAVMLSGRRFGAVAPVAGLATPLARPLAGRGAAGQHRRGGGRGQGLRRARPESGAAGRQHRPGGRLDARRQQPRILRACGTNCQCADWNATRHLHN